jgi:hypothetical protein
VTCANELSRQCKRGASRPAHKVVGVKEAIEAAGATSQYLPQFSPDLNRSEMPFSAFKVIPAQGLGGLCRRIGSANPRSCAMSQLLQTCQLRAHMIGICSSIDHLLVRVVGGLSARQAAEDVRHDSSTPEPGEGDVLMRIIYR